MSGYLDVDATTIAPEEVPQIHIEPVAPAVMPAFESMFTNDQIGEPAGDQAAPLVVANEDFQTLYGDGMALKVLEEEPEQQQDGGWLSSTL